MSKYVQKLIGSVAGKKYCRNLVADLYYAISRQVNIDILEGDRIDVFGICYLKLRNPKRTKYSHPKTSEECFINRKRIRYNVNATFRKTLGRISENI